MAVHLLKMKRKDIQNINDDFSDFSRYSPAIKIRRLDADLPPIIEEDEPEFPSWIKRPDATDLPSNIEREMPATSENVDGAIVLCNILTTPLPLSPSRFSIDSDILLQIKKDIRGQKHSSLVKSAEDGDDDEEGRKNTRRNECLAVVPWNPLLQQLPCTTSGNMESEMEEDEQMGEATTMEIEEDNTLCGYSHQMNENLPQWQWQQEQQQKQQCLMIPQYSQMNEKFPLWQQQQQQQQHCMMIPQYNQMNDSFLQWQLQQQQQQFFMMNQQPQQSSSAPVMQMQYQ